MTTSTIDFPQAEIVKKFINDNILQYLQKPVEITNKTVIRWYEHDKMQKDRRQRCGPE